jgi:hypothetical protein
MVDGDRYLRYIELKWHCNVAYIIIPNVSYCMVAIQENPIRVEPRRTPEKKRNEHRRRTKKDQDPSCYSLGPLRIPRGSGRKWNNRALGWRFHEFLCSDDANHGATRTFRLKKVSSTPTSPDVGQFNYYYAYGR